MAKTPNYDINYDDKRFTQVESDKKVALSENDKTYDGMIANSDKYYNDQIAAAQDYANQQSKIANDNTEFAIEQIEQQREYAEKDYQKEQSGAYVDWQKQSGEYGVNAEQQAAAGLAGSGYSESSQVAMYNQYQNRVATAREALVRVGVEFDNAIKDARLQNNALQAEIAYNALQTKLELSLQGFQYKNELLLDKAATKREIDNTYYGRYQDVLNQINTENAMAEQIRQYEKTFDENVRQYNKTFDENVRQYNKTFDENVRQFNKNYNLDVKKFNEQKKQWKDEFNEMKRMNNHTITSSEQKTAADNCYASIEQGVMPSDAMIKKAGLNKSTVSKMVKERKELISLDKQQTKANINSTKASTAYTNAQTKKVNSSGSSGSSGSSSGKSGSSGSSGSKSGSSGSSGSKTPTINKAKSGSSSGGFSKVSNAVKATSYIEALVKSGATKDKVANELANALKNGALTQAQYNSLYSKFCPRGVQY